MRYAQRLPEGTFGHAYGHFMARRDFKASDRPPVRFIDDEELAYVAQRAREVHDLWHVLFNCKTTVLGELALKAVEFVQVRCCKSDKFWALVNTLRQRQHTASGSFWMMQPYTDQLSGHHLQFLASLTEPSNVILSALQFLGSIVRGVLMDGLHACARRRGCP